MKRSVIFTSFLLITISLCSCRLIFHKNLSLSIRDYEKIGMPDYRKVWDDQDYMKALSALSSLRVNKPYSFPRKNNLRSGRLFEKLVDIKNLDFVNDTTISLYDRALRIQYYSSVQNNLSRMYTNELSQKQYYAGEIIDTYIFGLHINDKMLELAEKIMDPQNTSVSGLRSGTAGVVMGYVNNINFTLEALLRDGTYRNGDLKRLSNQIARTLSINKKWIDQPSRLDISRKIQAVIDGTKSRSIKRNLKKMLDIIS